MTAVQYSAFQTLPSVIIQDIFFQLRLVRDNDENTTINPYIVGVQLNHVMKTCTLWRQVTLAHLYNNITCYLDCSNSSVTYGVKNDKYIDSCADLYYARYVHTVNYVINLNNFDHDAASFGLQKIAHMTPHINTKKVYVQLFDYENDTITDNSYCARLQQLAVAIKQISSTAIYADVSVDISPDSVNIYRTDYLAFAQLLFEGILKTSLRLQVNEVTFSATPKYYISGLVQLSCNWNNSYKHVVQIIHANAPSLCELSIDYYNYNELETIFSNDNSDPIVYPNLKHLSMNDRFNQGLIPVNPNSVTAPFPVLERLFLNIDYPFSDDIVFRGNYDTLETLKITASNNLESVFLMEGASLKRNFIKLCSISIDGVLLDLIEASDNNNIYVFIIERAPMLRRILIEDLNISMALIWKLQNGTKYKNVKHLHCNEQYMTLEDTINIIQGMPSLHSLHCHITALGDTFNDMDISQIYQLVTTKYGMIGKGMNYWQILNIALVTDDIAIACAMLIASVCPNLSTIQFNANNEKMSNMFRALCASRLYRMCRLKVRAVVSTYASFCLMVER